MDNMTKEQALARAHDLVERHHPHLVKHHEAIFTAIHRYGFTFVIMDVYRTTGPDSRPIRKRRHFAHLHQGPIAQLSPVEGHEDGWCMPCTLAWRRANGIEGNVDDLRFNASYLPMSAMKADEAELEQYLATAPPEVIAPGAGPASVRTDNATNGKRRRFRHG